MSIRRPKEAVPDRNRLEAVLRVGFERLSTGPPASTVQEDVEVDMDPKQRMERLRRDSAGNDYLPKGKAPEVCPAPTPSTEDAEGHQAWIEAFAALEEAVQFADNLVPPTVTTVDGFALAGMVALNRVLQNFGVADDAEMEQFYRAVKFVFLIMSTEEYPALADEIERTEFEQTDSPSQVPDEPNSMDIGVGFFNSKKKGQAARQAFQVRGGKEIFIAYFSSVGDFKNLVFSGEKKKVFQAIKMTKSILIPGLQAVLSQITKLLPPGYFASTAEQGVRVLLDNMLDTKRSMARFDPARQTQSERTKAVSLANEVYSDYKKSYTKTGQPTPGGPVDMSDFASALRSALYRVLPISSDRPQELYNKRIRGLERTPQPKTANHHKFAQRWLKDQSKVFNPIGFLASQIGYVAIAAIFRIVSKCLLFNVDTVARWASLNRCETRYSSRGVGKQPIEVAVATCGNWSNELVRRIDAESNRLAPAFDQEAVRLKRELAALVYAWAAASKALNERVKARPKLRTDLFTGMTAQAFGTVANIVTGVDFAAIGSTAVPPLIFAADIYRWKNEGPPQLNALIGAVNNAIADMREFDDGIPQLPVPVVGGADEDDDDDFDDEGGDFDLFPDIGPEGLQGGF